MKLFAARALAVLVAVSFAQFTPAASSRAAQAPGDYYYNAGRRVRVVRSESRLAVIVPEGSAKANIASALAALPSVAATRDVKAKGVVEVTLNGASAKSAAPDVEAIGRAAGGEVVPVFFEPGEERDASTLFVATDLLVQFRPEVTRDEIDALEARYGVDEVESLGYAPNGFKLRVRGNDLDRNALTVANACFESGLCVFAHPDFLASRSPRFAPNDPQYAKQWHLNNTGQGGGTPGADVKAEAAWEITRGSKDVTIAVADTGIDFHHEDFAVMVDGVAKVRDPRDVVHGDDDPSPTPASEPFYEHGTAASGVATAFANNNLDVAGIAPNCRFMPIQLYAESTFTPNSTEADAFLWAADHGADVMSNSWGPDNPDTPLPDATRAAIDHATSTGRNGKGMAIFFAAGNSSSDTSHDNYISYPGVISIAASNNSDQRSSYSCYGAAVAVSAPSSGGTLGITTTDVSGSAGYAQGNVTFGFGGTSSACPLAAGVGALVLSVNPALTWQQVKAVLQQSADKIDFAAGEYDATGRSSFYGFGRVNAYEAVRLAQRFDAGSPQALLHAAGDVLGAGSTYQLDWSTVAPAPLASQTLEYSTDGGATYAPIASPAPGTQVYVWAVPDTLFGAVLVRLTVTDTNGKTATDTASLTAWAKPTISKVKLKQPAGGKRSLVVDGASFRVGEVSLFVGDVELTDVSIPSNRQNGDGTATRIVSKDARLKSLLPANVAVTITVRHARANQSSAPFTFRK